MAVAIEVVEVIENLSLFLQSVSIRLSKRGVCLLATPSLHSVDARLRLLLAGRLKRFLFRSDPTQINPIFLHPFITLLRWRGLIVENVSHHPFWGASLNSSLPLKLLASCMQMLGVQGRLDGDTLIMTVQRTQAIDSDPSP